MSRTVGNRLRRFWGHSLLEKFEALAQFYWLAKTRFYYRRFFGGIGRHSRIVDPLRLSNVQHIYMGDEVTINRQAFLLTLTLPEGPDPRLVIGDGCVIGHFNHITCVHEVIIGKKVLTADRVHISDNSHEFADPDIAILDQGTVSKGKVSVGDGSWIGENASVLSCHIGKHCVIGSNAVVMNDIPDYCVAVGAPARVVRQFDPVAKQWKRIVPDQGRG